MVKKPRHVALGQLLDAFASKVLVEERRRLKVQELYDWYESLMTVPYFRPARRILLPAKIPLRPGGQEVIAHQEILWYGETDDAVYVAIGAVNDEVTTIHVDRVSWILMRTLLVTKVLSGT